MDPSAALAELLTRQRAVLDALNSGPALTAGRLTDAWRLCERAGELLEQALRGDSSPEGLESELARARALSGLLALEVGRRRASVVQELSKVREARRRLSELDQRSRHSGSSCDVNG